MASTFAHAELDSRIPAKRHHRHTKKRKHHPHGHVRDIWRVLRPTFKFEVAVVSREEARQPDEHLSEWRVDIEVELALQVMRAEFSKVRLVPDNDVRMPNLIEARPARKKCVYCWRQVLQILLEEFRLCSKRQRDDFASNIQIDVQDLWQAAEKVCADGLPMSDL